MVPVCLFVCTQTSPLCKNTGYIGLAVTILQYHHILSNKIHSDSNFQIWSHSKLLEGKALTYGWGRHTIQPQTVPNYHSGFALVHPYLHKFQAFFWIFIFKLILGVSRVLFIYLAPS
jgi:hypothetical protein